MDSFNTEHAKDLGDVEAAVFIRGLQHLITSKGNTYGTERWWYQGTMEQLRAEFPYWTPRKLERVISSLVTVNVLIKEHLSGANRTCAYAFSNESRYLTADNPFAVDAEGRPCPFHETVKWSKQARAKANSPNGEMSMNPISRNGEMGTNVATIPVVPISRNGEMEALPPAPPTRKGGASEIPPSGGDANASLKARALNRTAESLNYGVRRVCDAYIARWSCQWPNLKPPLLQPASKQAVRDAIKSIAVADDTDYATADREVIVYVERLADERKPLMRLKWEIEDLRNGTQQNQARRVGASGPNGAPGAGEAKPREGGAVSRWASTPHGSNPAGAPDPRLGPNGTVR